ncbi:MAG: hypothetical protein EAZ85_07895 [Bacteroidetes bacterium]|nr:MAG: hypothetical protein EAZ85_07895 [Bacteroidota bacterium]TAG85052.1 MAG: hypothetical protein EAZ20_16095 [Bacteroidota bacterium]
MKKLLFLSIISFLSLIIFSCNNKREDAIPTKVTTKVKSLKTNGNLKDSNLFTNYLNASLNLVKPLENMLDNFSEEQISVYVSELSTLSKSYKDNPSQANFEAFTQKMGFINSLEYEKAELLAVNELSNLKLNYSEFIGMTSPEVNILIDEAYEQSIESGRGYRRCMRRLIRKMVNYLEETGDEAGARDMLSEGEYACWERHILGIR